MWQSHAVTSWILGMQLKVWLVCKHPSRFGLKLKGPVYSKLCICLRKFTALYSGAHINIQLLSATHAWCIFPVCVAKNVKLTFPVSNEQNWHMDIHVCMYLYSYIISKSSLIQNLSRYSSWSSQAGTVWFYQTIYCFCAIHNIKQCASMIRRMHGDKYTCYAGSNL